MIPVADDIALWRERAADARNAAQRMGDVRSRCMVLRIAQSYERMAQLAERRLVRRSTMPGVSRRAFGLAGLLGGGAGWVLGYLLLSTIR